MDIGKYGVLFGLATSLCAIILYALALRGNRKLLLAARASFGLTAASVFFCFGRLMYLVSHHRFEYEYVFNHSSKDLGWPWNYAATWAAQEGSFLLWAFWTAVIGILVAWKAGKWEARVMPFYISTLAFLFAILVWLSPYNILPRGTGPKDFPLSFPWPPINGMGLNASLQNYWMAIHPPTIFFGFASLSVPFVYAIAALIWRDYGSPGGGTGGGWASRVMPYVLMTTATLGIGLFMGGYWAYETQGWHGFWAWDPVENASLFPWLGGLGLLHGLVVQKSRGGMGRTNLFLAIVSWVMFLWGTFLTRSGVLASFSVHAFDMLAKDALALLIWMMVGHLILGIGLLIWRWRSIPGRPISDNLLSRDTGMTIAVSLMMMASVVVAIATSWPILSRWILLKHIPFISQFYAAKGMPALPLFYNKFSSFIVIPLMIVMGAVPFLAWGKTNSEKFLWKVLTPWLIAIGLGFLIVWFSRNEQSAGFQPTTPPVLVVVLGLLGCFAAIANIILAVRLLRVKAITLGGWLAHAGMGILLVGTVLTNVFEQTKNVVLIEGDGPVQTPFGYAVEFAGWTHDGLSQEEQEKAWFDFGHSMKILVSRIGSNSNVVRADEKTDTSGAAKADVAYTALTPVFRQHNLQTNGGEQQYMVWPDIHKEWFRDFYICPANEPQLLRPETTVREGQTAGIFQFHYDETRPEKERFVGEPTNYTVTYKRFYMHGSPGQTGTALGGEMILHMPDGRNIPFNAELQFSEEGGLQPKFTEIPGVNAVAFIKGRIDPVTKEINVHFELPDVPSRWMAAVAVTNKPMINFVWLGVILMGAGTFCAMVRRSLEARRGATIQTAASTGEGDISEPTPGSTENAGDPIKGIKGGKTKPARAAQAKTGEGAV